MRKTLYDKLYRTPEGIFTFSGIIIQNGDYQIHISPLGDRPSPFVVEGAKHLRQLERIKRQWAIQAV